MAQHTAHAPAAPPVPRSGLAACGPVAGLRQRKKQRTRDQLVRAAHRLFLRQGFADTTVDEIAAAVDVSQRTFFRYFASKDEVALALLLDAEDYFIQCLRDRPADENPLQALRAANRETWQGFGVDDGEAGSASAALEILQLIDTTPTLLAAHLRRFAEREHLVARVIAEREGVDPETDLRPRLLAAVFGAVLHASHEAWGAAVQSGADCSPAAMLGIFDRHLELLGPALAGDWHG